MSSANRPRQRKRNNKKQKSGKSPKSKQQKAKIKNNVPKVKRQNSEYKPFPMVFRLLIASMFMASIYGFKYYLLQQSKSNESVQDNAQVELNDTNESEVIPEITESMQPVEMIDIDMTQIIESADLDLTKTKIKEISPRFSKKKKKKIPALKIWHMKQFWTEQMAKNISTQLYDEFTDEEQRKESFYFAINRGNEKIRGNDNIENKTIAAHILQKHNAFSYCKYEYRRNLPLYQRILSYLNSSYVTNLMSKVLKQNVLGISDLFISVYFKDNFLSIHDDRGLGHYAFVNFLSQNWDSEKYGGSLNFNCKEPHKWNVSCYEYKPEFNDNIMFKVWPDTIPHHVKEVVVNKPRIAITGWYYTDNPHGVDWASIQEETGYGLQ